MKVRTETYKGKQIRQTVKGTGNAARFKLFTQIGNAEPLQRMLKAEDLAAGIDAALAEAKAVIDGNHYPANVLAILTEKGFEDEAPGNSGNQGGGNNGNNGNNKPQK